MKNLIIPEVNELNITLSEIDRYSKGLILCYKNNKTVGYIHYNDGVWRFSNSVDIEGFDICPEDESLIVVIKDIIKENIATDFKWIDFE